MLGSVDDHPVRVLVLPDPTWTERDVVIRAIEQSGYGVFDITAPMDSKVVCAAIINAPLTPPLVVVAHGDACQLLPAVALSLRTQHRATSAYVLIDPDAPPSTDTWPESPVFVVSAAETNGRSLRGWSVVSAPDGIADGVRRVIDQLVSS